MRWLTSLKASLFGLGIPPALTLIVTAAGIAGVVVVLGQPADDGDRRADGARRAAIERGADDRAPGADAGDRRARRSALAGALAMTRVVARLLFAVEPTDPMTYAAVIAVLAAVAAIACLVPARRAAAIDPMRALRAD